MDATRDYLIMLSKVVNRKTNTILYHLYMKYKMMELIKSSATNEFVYRSLESIFSLQEQLTYSTNLKQLYEDIFNWLEYEFKITNR